MGRVSSVLTIENYNGNRPRKIVGRKLKQWRCNDKENENMVVCKWNCIVHNNRCSKD